MNEKGDRSAYGKANFSERHVGKRHLKDKIVLKYNILIALRISRTRNSQSLENTNCLLKNGLAKMFPKCVYRSQIDRTIQVLRIDQTC